MKYIKYSIVVLMVLTSLLCAEEVSFDDFSMVIRHLPQVLSLNNDYKIDPSLGDRIMRLAAITRVRSGRRMFLVDMRWAADVVESLAGEHAEARRRLLYVNMVDTLNGMLVELSSDYPAEAFSRQEMQDALDRALGRTSEIRVSGDVMFDESVAQFGRPGLVVNEPGDAISLAGIQPSAQGSQGSVRAVSGSGARQSSGGFVGGTSGGSSGGSTRSGFSAAGGSAGSVSGSSGRMVSGGAANSGTSGRTTHGAETSVAAGQQSVQTHSSERPQQAAAQTQTAASSQVSRPAEPSRASPTPPPPPPKQPEPIRPPPKPKAGEGASMFFWIMMGIGTAGFVIIIFLIIKNLRTKVAQEQARIDIVEKDLPVDRMRSETVYEKALREAEQGNYAEAIRLLTIGSLLLLEARRVISYRDSLTNGEYLRELLVERQLHSMFTAPLALFDRLIYGFQSPDKRDFEVFRLFYLDLEKLKR